MSRSCDVLDGEWFQPAEQERGQYLRDLCDVLAMPQGQRVAAALLRDCGLGSPVSARQEHVAIYNFGHGLLLQICEASPNAGMNLLRLLFQQDGGAAAGNQAAPFEC